MDDKQLPPDTRMTTFIEVTQATLAQYARNFPFVTLFLASSFVAYLFTLLVNTALYTAMMLAAGFAAGYVLAVPELGAVSLAMFQYTGTGLDRTVRRWRGQARELMAMEDDNGINDSVFPASSGCSIDGQHLQLSLESKELEDALNELMDCFMRDFIDGWFQPLNHSHSTDFQAQTRSSLNAVALNLMEHVKHLSHPQRTMDLMTLLLYSVSNVLIVHMREYRTFCTSQLDIHAFMSQTDAYHGSFLASHQNDRLRSITLILLTRLASKRDVGSLALREVLRELVSTSALMPLVEYISKPANINRLIVQLLLPVVEAKHGPTDETGLLAGGSKSQTTLVAAVESMSTREILHRNDSFAMFMEYMETISAPPFLRFWTNADIYKQFAAMSLKDSNTDSATLDLMRTDAMFVFDAHFGENAELAISLSAPDISGPTHELLVERMLDGCLKSPSPDCFNEAQQRVLEILEVHYIRGFFNSLNARKLNVRSAMESVLMTSKKSPGSTGSGDISAGSPTAISINPPLPDDASAWKANIDSFPPGSMDSLHSSVEEDVTDGWSASFETGTQVGSSESIYKDAMPTVTFNPTDDAIVHVAEAITALREQMMHADAAIDKARSKMSTGPLPNIQRNMEVNAKIRKLQKTRKGLETEVEALLAMAKAMDENEVVEGEVEGKIVSLQNIRVRVNESGVNPVSTPATPSTPLGAFGRRITHTLNTLPGAEALSEKVLNPSISFLTGNQPAHTGGSLMNRIKQMEFVIEIERLALASPADPSVGRGWLLTRQYANFVNLHESLTAQFPKVNKITFPALKKIGIMASNNAVLQEERLQLFLRDLETYLQQLLIDQLLCESKNMQDFFRPDTDISTSTLESKKKVKAIELRQRVLTVLKNMPKIGQRNNRNRNNLKPLSNATVSDSDTESIATEGLHVPASPQRRNLSRSQSPRSLGSHGDANTRPGSVEPPQISHSDVSLMIDTFFALLTDVFDFHSQHWLRRKAMSVLRQILLTMSQQMWVADAVKSVLQTLGDGLASQLGVRCIGLIMDSLWPMPTRTWFSSLPVQPPAPTDEQLESERKQAFQLVTALVTDSPLATDITDSIDHANASMKATVQFYLYRMVGRENTLKGVERVLNMLQIQEFNRVLVINVLEVLTKLTFAEDRRCF